MRYLLIVIFLAGCNLFAPNEAPKSLDAGPSDADSVLPDASADAPVDQSLGPDAAAPDMKTLDLGPSPDVPCAPESDEDLCASLAAECGQPVSVAGLQQWAFEAEDNASGQCGISGGLVVFCNSGGTTSATVDVPADGDYLFEVVARAQVFGDVPALAELAVDGVVVANLPLRETLPDPQAYNVVLPLSAGSHGVRWRFANDAVFGGMDRNLYVDSFFVAGPIGAVPDRCGELRALDCGACAAHEVCGLNRANLCQCPCPLADGSCAPLGPHPDLDCLECLTTGWSGVSGGCSDGNACTNDSCDSRAGLCNSTPVVCQRGACEVGTCSGGSCQYVPAMDGDACGVGGVCASGLCGCADGIVTETNCNDNNDNDCDGLRNCEDPDCDGQNCGAGNSCSMGICQ